MKKFALAALATAVIAQGAALAQSNNNSFGLTLRGFVPVICTLDFQAATGGSSRNIELGQLSELCNAATGYRIVALHDANVSGATLTLSGAGSKPLSASGRTVLFDSAMPGRTVRDVSLQLAAGSSGVSAITFVIEPSQPST